MSVIIREPRSRLDLDAIKRDNPLPALVGAVIDLKKVGNEWKGCCPFHAEKTPSFTIFAGGYRFHCFGCGASGDCFEWTRRTANVPFREAALRLANNDLPTTHYAPLPPAEDASNRVEEALAVWDAAQPVQGTLAETYLHHRSIRIGLPESIRFAWLRYGKAGPERPVLVAAVTSPDGQFQGVQRTFLNPAGTGKASVPKPKLALGKMSGGAIRLSPPAENLVVVAGLEDGLSVMEALGRAVWVATGDTMLAAVQFPAIVKAIAVGGDNDASGRANADKAARAFATRGLEARTFFPPEGFKDFNSVAQGGSR